MRDGDCEAPTATSLTANVPSSRGGPVVARELSLRGLELFPGLGDLAALLVIAAAEHPDGATLDLHVRAQVVDPALEGLDALQGRAHVGDGNLLLARRAGELGLEITNGGLTHRVADGAAHQERHEDRGHDDGDQAPSAGWSRVGHDDEVVVVTDRRLARGLHGEVPLPSSCGR